MQFTNRFHQLSPAFYSKVTPSGLPHAQLVSLSKSCYEQLGLELSHKQLVDITAGNMLLPGMDTIAAVYSGHQFGSYNPQLGDGRAMLLGEWRHNEHSYELQLKGAGTTPYSRFADGRAVLRSSIREFLASEAMHQLGIPTTRALSLVHSPLPVNRETVETAACVLRVAESFVRFGSFEYFHYNQKPEQVRQLADHVLNCHMPQHATEPNCYYLMFEDVVLRTARMIADWQAIGFAHGVMNTDNMSILGLSLDYGPFGFLDNYDPGFICNHSDHQGRYAFSQQPSIGLWNLNALGHGLSSLLEKEEIIEALSAYEPELIKHYQQNMRNKLGLLTAKSHDKALIEGLLNLMQANKADYTNTFRALTDIDTNTDSFIDQFVDRDAAKAWLKSYKNRTAEETTDPSERSIFMKSHNPKYILRNYLAQNAIVAAEQGDYSLVNTLLNVLSKPFDDQNEYNDYARLPPDWSQHLEISCSS